MLQKQWNRLTSIGLTEEQALGLSVSREFNPNKVLASTLFMQTSYIPNTTILTFKALK